MTNDDYQELYNECSLIAVHVASAFGVSMGDMYSNRRSSYGVNMGDVRSMYFYIAREHTSASFPIIGKALCKDHTTAISAHKKATIKFSDNSWQEKLFLVCDALGFNRQGS